MLKKVHDDKIECVKYMERSNQVATVGRDHLIKITCLRMQKTIATLEHGDFILSQAVSKFDLSPSENYLAVGGHDGKLFVFNLKTF